MVTEGAVIVFPELSFKKIDGTAKPIVATLLQSKT